MFGIAENEPIPGMAVTVLPQANLNPLWVWMLVFQGEKAIRELTGGDEQNNSNTKT